jgi:hypothetical protein
MNTAVTGIVLAQTTNTFDPNKVTPGLLGFVVVVAIGLATWFLLKSMNGHLRNVDPRFAKREEDAPQGEERDADVTTPDERTRP